MIVDANGRHNIGRLGNFGQLLSQVTQLGYSSHQVSGNAAATISLQLQVDYDVTDANNAFQGRLVFEPYQTPANVVQQNVWQTWNAMAGRWWASGSPGNTLCPQATPCTWSQVLSNWPNVGIHGNPGLGAIIFRAGGPTGFSFTGSVDNFTLGISGVDTTYNFDPAPVTFLVTPAAAPTAADNDYTRINNAVQAAMSGDTIVLSGTFNWTEANAAASWALGSDGVPSTIDDYSILVPANRNNITFTASSLGSATIQGPGDLGAVNLEGVMYFDGGDNQGWILSNIRYLDFDLAIGMFNGAGGSDAFNGTQIINNYIRIPSDLNTAVAPLDVNQNIGIHFSFGTNQLISGNTIETPGTGVSNSAGSQFSSVVGMQSNTSGGSVYDGLQITNNILRSLGTQSADPETFLGIWENSHGHSSNITVSGNQFLNASLGNNPALNLQRAFRVTSHSSLSTTVTYSNNRVEGANIGFEWLAGSNFAGNQPVRLTSNTILNGATGVLVQSNGIANIHFNRIVGNSVVGVNNATPGAVNAENNWWGCNYGPGAGGAGCSGTANGVLGAVDANPWLTLTTAAVPNSIPLGGTSAVTSRLVINSDAVDTTGSGNIPNGTPASFAGINGTVSPPTGTTTTGVTGTTFTATAYGAGSASTSVDGQTVSAPITVVPVCATVSIPDGITGLPNTQINVPINTTDLTSRGVFGYEGAITYNSSIMTYVGFDQVGTLSSGLTVVVNSSTPGTLGIVASSTSATPLAGSGVLLNLRFFVVGAINNTPSPVNFTSFMFNEGNPCSITDGGSVTVISGTISGTVIYVNGTPTTPGVSNVTISGTGPGGNVSTVTTGSGTYSLSGFGPGAYVVTPSKLPLPLGSTNSAIGNLDTTRIAQHIVGLITLNANQIIAGDVTGNGSVSNLDATYISQWKVGIANPGTTGTWIFQPTSRNYPNVNASFTGENYNAILKGDVTGNWNPAEAPNLAEEKKEPSKDAIFVAAPRVRAISGSPVVVPIRVTNVSEKGVTGYDFDVTYDPLVLEPSSMAAEISGTISDGMTVVSNSPEPGRLSIVVFGTAPMNGEGVLINLRFSAVGAVGSSTILSIGDLMLNEGEIESSAVGGELHVVSSLQPGTISGKLLTSTGQGVPNTRVTLTATTGETRSARSSSFGNFEFGSLVSGETYTLSVESRLYTFTPVTVSMGDSAVNVDLIAQ